MASDCCPPTPAAFPPHRCFRGGMLNGEIKAAGDRLLVLVGEDGLPVAASLNVRHCWSLGSDDYIIIHSSR